MGLCLIVAIFSVFNPYHLKASHQDSISIWIANAVEGGEKGSDYISVDTVILNKALKSSQIHEDFENETKVHFYLGLHHNLKDEPLKALGHFQNAMKIIENKNISSMKARTLMTMGVSYYTLGEYEKAIQVLEEALKANQGNSNPVLGINIQNNLANALARQGKTQEAQDLYQKLYESTLTLASTDSTYIDLRNNLRMNLGFIYLEKGNGQKALSLLSKYHNHVITKDNPWAIAPSYGNLAYCYYLLGDFDKAYDFYYRSLEISEGQNMDHITKVTYKDLSDTYRDDGKLDLAILYLEKYFYLKDSLQGAEVRQKLYQLESEHKNAIQKQEITELEQKNRIQRQQLFITYGGIAGLLGLGFFIFRNMRIKNKHKKEIAQEKLKQTRQREELQILKVEQLNKELKLKKQDITRMAIDISKKQEFADDLITKMDDVKQFLEAKGNKQWRILEQTIRERLQTNDEQSLFNENIDQINQTFYRNLKDRFPSLSKNDLVLCGLIRLGLSNKEMANLRGVSNESIRVGKYRLKKKLNCESSQEVERFLQTV